MTDISMRDTILDAAEARARSGGYHGFSFRDLAADVGVKSSSVHYHFPTKADLAETLTRRYTERARDHLGAHGDLSADEAIARVTNLFEAALLTDDKMCLCGLFGAERDALPPEVTIATAAFFRLLIDYLTDALEGDEARAAAIVAQLEGGLILARTLDDPAMFATCAQAE